MMSNCTHHWQQIDVDLFRPAIKVRCVRCHAIGEILDPTRSEITSAFYASESTPIPFDDAQRVCSANTETLIWQKDLAQ